MRETHPIAFEGGPRDGEVLDFSVESGGQPMVDIESSGARGGVEHTDDRHLYRLRGSTPETWLYTYAGRIS